MIHHCTQANRLFPKLFCERGAVKPDDVVLLSEGEHLVGELSQHPSNYGVTFAAEPGQKACIVGRLDVNAPHTTIEGLEITGPYRWGIRVGMCDYVEIINNRIHHISQHPKGNGIVTMEDGHGHLYYGNIVWRCGVSSLCHGFYIAGRGNKRFMDNICFENAGYAFHVWSEEDRIPLEGYEFESNVAFAPYAGNFVAGGRPVKDLALRDNLFVHPSGCRQPMHGVNLGWDGKNKVDVSGLILEGNGFWGGKERLRVMESAQYAGDRMDLVRQNRYKPNLWHVAVFDPAERSSVGVTLPEELKGKSFRCFNVLDMDGKINYEVLKGTVPEDRVIDIPKHFYDYEPEFGCYLLKIDN